ncbi:MAG: hypothetical protein H6Q52_1576 [Deltaproteobacteria bacterium]|nr:hypothetical protein [Deltaproteobacteria bacterium]
MLTKLSLYGMKSRTKIMYYAIGIMALISALRLGYEFWRLVGMADPNGAIDLILRYEEVEWWFAGESTHRTYRAFGYTPASYVFLWLPFGWLELWPARWLWALTSVVLLAGLIRFFLKESEAHTRLERIFLIIIFLSVYPTAITIGNGQLGIHLLLAIAGAVLLVRPGQKTSITKDMLAALFFIAGLTKVSFGVPFFWILLFMPGRLRPAVLVVTGYVLFTIFGASFQPEPLFVLMKQLLSLGTAPVAAEGGAHLGRLMDLLGWTDFNALGSLFILGALGVWTWFYRSSDPLVLLGVTGIVARLWTYHRMYDDILILLPLVALYRIAKRYGAGEKEGLIAGMFFVCGWLGLEMPGTLGRMSFPWNLPYDIGQTALWIAMLVFLVFHVRKERAPLFPYSQGVTP